MILLIKQIAIEGPGSLGEFFKATDWDTETVELEKGDKLPIALSNIEAIIILGGPMNVYQEDKYPFLNDEDILLKKAIEREVPVLGICLGAQLLAKASGGSVKGAEKKEIGWHRVELTDHGAKDLLFEGLDKSLGVFQWHEDTFEIGRDSQLLATSKGCNNQAFRVGKNAYGLQFHIEVTDQMIKKWSREYFGNKDPKLRLKGYEMLSEYYAGKDLFTRQANRIYLNFSKIINHANNSF